MALLKSNELSQVEDDNPNSKLLGGSLYDTKLVVSKDHKSLVPTLLKSDVRKVPRKRISSRIDYNFYNYCSTCELKYPKLVLRCKECKQKVRTRPWHRSKIVDRRRI